QPRDALALSRGESDERLIEQQYTWSCRKGNTELDQSLCPVGQSQTPHPLEPFESEEARQHRAFISDLRERRRGSPHRKARGIARLAGEAQILRNRQRWKQIRDLEGARKHQMGKAT